MAWQLGGRTDAYEGLTLLGLVGFVYICIVGAAGGVGLEIQLTLDRMGRYSEGVKGTCIMTSRAQWRAVYASMACFVE